MDPPTFVERHPRAWALMWIAMWFASAAVSLLKLERDGFSWVVALTAVFAASNLGYWIARLERPDPGVNGA
ncbi:hypothetical protein N802_04520 [Knoellia sinensis KCTC 19936]|uniref:Uncharacterized protein n=1 Tax=Knoellia sinensis KCTC 19936 TaxID=1385520 RepID=A0A0A0J1R8_9MICO|nr:hypothetical protein N802_04520 [Knoellia sinensis KCTC 19936]